MAKYWSASKVAFYDDTIVSGVDLPPDAVVIPDADYKNLMAKQDAGFVIVAGADGYPTAVAQSCGQCTCLKHELEIASSETLGHVRIGPSVKVAPDGTIDVGTAVGDERDRDASKPNYGLE